MNTCFVKKYKKEVNDNSLLLYNHFRIFANISSTDYNYIDHRYCINGSTHFKVVGNGYFKTDPDGEQLQELNLNSPADTTIIFGPGNYYLLCNNKYTLKSLSYVYTVGAQEVPNCGLSLNLDEISYSTELVTFLLNGIKTTGEFKIISNKLVDYYFNLGIGEGKANIESISNANVTVFRRVFGRNWYGSIESLGNMINCDTIFCQQSPELYGTVEGLAQAQVRAGRTSGDLNVLCGSTKVTYQGVTIPIDKTVKITFDSSVSGGYTISKNY